MYLAMKMRSKWSRIIDLMDVFRMNCGSMF
jgi:hypothetical protein